MQAAKDAAKSLLNRPARKTTSTSSLSSNSSASSVDTTNRTHTPHTHTHTHTKTPTKVGDIKNANVPLPAEFQRDHKHDTEVREVFKPAITKEVIRPVERVEETIAIDREIHQDHYQTRIQPVEDKVVTEERHTTQVLPVQHREVRHAEDEAAIRKKLEQEALNFKSTTTTLPAEHVKVTAGTIAGEHIHHHVHEIVQPVIEREVVQPTVVHTTVPIHERIEHSPTFHPPTVQPKMTMEEFRRAGGSITGKPEVRDVFEGEPLVRENGGADMTHPNAYGLGTRPGTIRGDEATPRSALGGGTLAGTGTGTTRERTREGIPLSAR